MEFTQLMQGTSPDSVQVSPNALHTFSPPSLHSLPVQFMTTVVMEEDRCAAELVLSDSHTKQGFSLSSVHVMP